MGEGQGVYMFFSAMWPGDNPNAVFGGLAVRSWGRIGKVMQYAGGLTALIDIVGPEWFTNLSTRADNIVARIRDKNRWANSRYEYPVEFMVAAGVSALIALAVAPFWVARSWNTPCVHPPCGMANYIVLRGFLLLTAPVAGAVAGVLAFVPIILVILAALNVAARMLRVGGKISGSTVSLRTAGFFIITIGFGLDLMAS